MPEYRTVQLDLLNEPPEPVRVAFDETKLAELAGDIRIRGLLQPIVVKAVPPEPTNGFRAPENFSPEAWECAGGRYEVVAGHRRMLAARMAGLLHVPVRVSGPNEQCDVGDMLSENSFREDVTAAEEGWKLCEYIEKHKPTIAQLCALVGRSEEWVNERIRLVRTDGDIAEACACRKISFGVAKELLRVNRHTASSVLRCSPDDFSDDQVKSFERHRAMLLDLCIRAETTSTKVARMYVEQWKASLVPPPAGSYGGNGQPDYTPPPIQQKRCLLCGGTDEQNFLYIPVHAFEKNAVLQILRTRGLEVYE